MAALLDGAGKRRAAGREAGCVLSALPGTSGIDEPLPQGYSQTLLSKTANEFELSKKQALL
jgi:hypothetical protein